MEKSNAEYTIANDIFSQRSKEVESVQREQNSEIGVHEDNDDKRWARGRKL